MGKTSTTQDGFVSGAFLELMGNDAEFTLSLEGTGHLPYEVTVVSVDTGEMRTVLKTFRPLPVRLRQGAPALASIAAAGDFWKARLLFRGRTGYLQYLFDLPDTMEATARREHPRYPFRLREEVSVFVQDASLPGLGAVGKVLDLSLGGMVFKPERIFDMENNTVLKLDTTPFPRGKSFPIIRVFGLPSLFEPLNLRGEVAHSSQKGEDITVAFAFGLLQQNTKKSLSMVLEARDTKPLETPPSAKPAAFLGASRRRHRRFPFRPRENTYVHVQNTTPPKWDASGPLRNLSAGGFVFQPTHASRPGELGKLEIDGELFKKGQNFPTIWIVGLKGSKGHIRVCGEVVHSTLKEDGLYVAFEFGQLEPETKIRLSKTLDARIYSQRRFTRQNHPARRP